MPIAVLIDAVSIQAYIFGSNKLKENIGASYIIEQEIYRKMIPKALAETGIDSGISLDKWQERPEYYQLQEEPEARVEVGYIGGGNALLLFRSKDDAKAFIKVYSRQILQYFPGVRLAFAMGDLSYDNGFVEDRKKLNEQLLQNKSQAPVYVLPFKHGVVKDCALSNEGQETDYRKHNNISQASAIRLMAAKKSQADLAGRYELQLQGKNAQYAFTAELEELGQPDEKGYVAIVHADGNGMGARFTSCKSLQEVRELSKAVAELAQKTMNALIHYVVNELMEKGKLSKENGFNISKDENGRPILPLRPIIAGGDDITIICEGKLGVHLAEKLLEFMMGIEVAQQKISACAGVAVANTKYPFYRIYSLSEELIKEAKAESRDKNDSWLSFMISTGGFSGEREDIIAQKYLLPNGKKLTMNPYRVSPGENALKSLKKGIVEFREKWPGNKQKALRDVLTKGEAAEEYFLTELNARGLSLPNFGSPGFSEKIWQDNKTPYFDMVELMDFYPKELLSL